MAFQKINSIPQGIAPNPFTPAAAAPNELADFRGFFKVETYPHNAVIYRPGDPATRMYLLKSGRVRLLRSGRSGSRAVLAILRPGEMFGDLISGAGGQMDEMAVAAGEAEVWCIEGRDFQALVEGRPALAMEMIQGLTDRLRGLRRRVQGLTFKDVPARLAETLLTIAESHGERCPHGGEYDLRRITQQDLADLVGASRSFVSTLINEMKRDGALGNVGRTLCIRDQKALKKISTSEK